MKANWSEKLRQLWTRLKGLFKRPARSSPQQAGGTT